MTMHIGSSSFRASAIVLVLASLAVSLDARQAAAGGAGQGTVVQTKWCDMTAAQRTAIWAPLPCIPAKQKKTINDNKGKKPKTGETKWASPGTVCIGAATNRGKALARTTYDPSSGKVAGVVIFSQWFTASGANKKFSLMQEANRVGWGPLPPLPGAGKKNPTFHERLRQVLVEELWKLFVKIRGARSRITFGTVAKDSNTSAADWKLEVCNNLDTAKTDLDAAKKLKDHPSTGIKVRIQGAKDAGVDVSDEEAQLKKACTELDDALKEHATAKAAK